ncbi:MAG TPA: class I SAM-dependent methyltransferase [Micromonosporaceae bacterium]|nr:class I SAM-dependent methyltransferase [Micromonosporaceae bacterium]
MPIEPGLGGVAETALWTLWFRSLEARRNDAVLSDPRAVDLVDSIDYPFAERFGQLFPAQVHIQALRVLAFDLEVRRFLANHPGGTVVALGEGLETQFWRVDNGSVRWLTVDLPGSVALRRRLLPEHDRQRSFAGSALDPAWTDLVNPGPGVLITAQGLLMYLRPEQVHALVTMCARRLPGGTLVFDAVPPWMARLVGRGTPGYQPPPLRWTLRPAEIADLAAIDPAVAEVREVQAPRGRGVVGWLAPQLGRLPVVRRNRPVILALRFGATAQA